MYSVSIIVASRNGVDRLPRLIASMQKLELSEDIEIEAILVDSASTDGTYEYLRQVFLPFPIRVCRAKVAGHSHALNIALQLCSKELLLFTDDDCEVTASWVSAYRDAAENFDKAGFFFGKIKPVFLAPKPTWWFLVPRSMSGRDQGDRTIQYSRFERDAYPIGCNMALRRSALGGTIQFDEHLGPKPGSVTPFGADTKLGLELIRNGVHGCYVPDSVVVHHIESYRLKWSYQLKHAYYSGRSSLYYKLCDISANRSKTQRYSFSLLLHMIKTLISSIRALKVSRRASLLILMKLTGTIREWVANRESQSNNSIGKIACR